MFTRNAISEGMLVYSKDGEKLGKVFILDDDGFHIEKGFFFPKDYLARYSDIREVEDDRIYLSRDKAELLEGREAWEGPSASSTVSPECYGNTSSTTVRYVEITEEVTVVDEHRGMTPRRTTPHSNVGGSNSQGPAHPTDEPPYRR